MLLPILAFGLVPPMTLANIAARGIDTFLDPLVASWSDRNTHRLGRRRIFMLVGAAPLALATGLTFFPPADGPSSTNVIYLCVMLTLYYGAFSLYVAPYLALLPEIAPAKKDNVTLSTMMAAAALVGGLVAINAGTAVITALGTATPVERAHSTQTMVGIFAAIAFVLLVVPIAFIPEREIVKDDGGPKAHQGLVDSLLSTLRDRAFLPYVLGTTLFAFGFNIVRAALPFFVEVLMKKNIDYPAPIAVFGVAALMFPVVGFAAARLGKKPVMLAGAVILAAALAGFYFVTSATLGVLLLAVSGVGVSVFLAVPNAILSDICNANALRTGERREAMFFGAQGFLQKINLGVSTALFALLLEMGRSVDNPIGVRWAGPMAALALVLAAVCYALYPEHRIRAELAAGGVSGQE